MKRISIIKSIIFAAVALAAGGAWAATETVGDYTWSYRINGETAEIFNGYSSAISPKPTGSVTVPATLGGYPVTSIGFSAFQACSGLTSVTIPDGVISIGDYVFSDCSGLTSVEVPNSVTNIGAWAFDGCSGLTSVTIPSSVTSIGSSAFYGCSGLTSVTIPDGVMNIGGWAFCDCTGLSNVTIGNGVTNIGYGAFCGCTGLMSLTIPGNVEFIGPDAFCSCTGLRSVSIGDGVTSVGASAFSMCPRLTRLTVPNSVQEIGNYAFAGCENLLHLSLPKRFEDHLHASVIDNCPLALEIVYRDTVVPSPEPPPEPTPTPTPTPEPTVTYGGVVADMSFAKAQTVMGALYRGGNLAGTVELKFGKINARKETVKVAASATVIADGKTKKITAKAATVELKGGTMSDRLTFKAPIGEMAFEMSADGTFTLKNGSYLMAEATVGGALKGGERGTFRLADFDFAVPGELQEDLLPHKEEFDAAGGKWKFIKNATVKWAKDRTTKEYALVVDDTKGKTNLSSLKLTYAAKTGIFKGSFKAYALEEKNGKTKLVKYTVNVLGLAVDGVGQGEATCKKPAGGPWPVTVE